MSNVHVVQVSAGDYEDYYTRILRAYTDADEARRFVEGKNREVQELRGLEKAVELMCDAWEAANPRPYTKGAYGDNVADCSSWYDKLGEERERIEKALKIKEAYASLGDINERQAERAYYSTQVIAVIK